MSTVYHWIVAILVCLKMKKDFASASFNKNYN